MLIVVDTREQLPYWKGPDILKTALKVGDYTTAKLHNRYHIERKSAQDLYGTLTRGNRRFKKEIIRAHEKDIKMSVYVECTKKFFIEKQFDYYNMLKFPSEGLRKMIATLEERYFVEFVWCGSRHKAKKMVYNRLKKEEAKWKK